MSSDAWCDLCGASYDPRHDDHVCEPSAVREVVVTLKKRVATLKKRVTRLEMRVERLETDARGGKGWT